MSCGSHRGVKLQEHAIEIVKKELEKRIQTLISFNKIFGFIPGKGTADAIFIVKRKQKEYLKKAKKLYMCFVDIEKAFDRVPRKMMKCATTKKSSL